MDFIECAFLVITIESLSKKLGPLSLTFCFDYFLLSEDIRNVLSVAASFALDLSMILGFPRYWTGILLMFVVSSKCRSLGELESYIIGSLSGLIFQNLGLFDPNLIFPIYSLYAFFRVHTLFADLDLSQRSALPITIIIQIILLYSNQSFIYWVLQYKDLVKYWAIVSAFGVFFVYCSNVLEFPYMVQRKMFHFLVLFIFVPGLGNIPLMSAAFLSALNAFVLLEKLRHFSYDINDFFLRFIDARDSKEIIVTHIYLLTGVGLPVLLSPLYRNSSPLLPLAGVLSLGIGDTCACLIGYYLGRIKLPYRNKTFEGTLACYLSMLVFLTWSKDIFHNLPWFVINPVLHAQLVAIAAYEAYTMRIDNLVLPIFAVGLFTLI